MQERRYALRKSQRLVHMPIEMGTLKFMRLAARLVGLSIEEGKRYKRKRFQLLTLSLSGY